MARKLIIQSSYVVNVVIVNEDSQWTPPEGCTVIDDPTDGYAGVGDWYEVAEGILYRPVAAVPPDAPESLQEQNDEQPG
jgi:hypothetical protein